MEENLSTLAGGSTKRNEKPQTYAQGLPRLVSPYSCHCFRTLR